MVRRTPASPALPLFLVSILVAPVPAAEPAATPPPATRDADLLDPLVVTGSPLGGAQSEQVQPVTVLEGRDLQLQLEPTLGETLSKTPGVRSTYFGPAASRPVIRGLDGDRVRILQNGLNTIDASATSVDHAVSFDPVSVGRIEIVRGPASVLYGPNAIGGVVNVIDGRIPDHRIEAPIQGSLGTRYSSNSDGIGGDFQLEGGVGGFAWHLEGYRRQDQDLRIPGDARSARLRAIDPLPSGEKEENGRLENSYLNNQGFSAGSSYIWDGGYFGLSYSGFDTDYGSPAEKDVSIDLEQRRWDFHGAFHRPFQGIKEIDYRFGLSDYQHTEYEGGEPGTTFTNQGYDGRLEITHEKLGPLEGAFGYQIQRSDFEATGEEKFLPEVLTQSHSLFLFEEAALGGHFKLQGGLRYDHTSVDASEDPDFGPRRKRDFDGVSGSLGIVYTPADDYTVALSTSWTERAPTYQELFADGPHVATGAFEIGDDQLGAEEALGLDLSLRKTAGCVTGSVTGFYNRFSRFIGQFPTGELEDGLPVYAYRGTGAEFYGIEAETTFHLLGPVESPEKSAPASATAPASADDRLDLQLRADYVRAKDTRSGDPLPRISPFHASAGLDYQHERFGASLEGVFSARQNKVADNELPTDSYFMVNAAVTYRIPMKDTTLDLYVKGVNLTDEEAREHTSFLKDIAPLGGRGVVAGAKLTF